MNNIYLLMLILYNLCIQAIKISTIICMDTMLTSVPHDAWTKSTRYVILDESHFFAYGR